MLAPRPELERKIEAAREALAAAEEASIAIAEVETEALETKKGHEAWRAKRDAAGAEIDRLVKLICALEMEAASSGRIENEEELRRRHRDKLESNKKLAVRI